MAATNIEKSVTHTRSVKSILQHTWVIENFSNNYLANPESSDPEYPSVSSTSFTCSQEKRVQFAIQLYPKGKNKASKDYISVFLDLTFKEPAKIPIKFKFSILNARNKIGHSYEGTQIFNENSSCWGWKPFIEQKVLLDKDSKTTKGLLPDDKLTLLLEVELYSEPVTQAIGDPRLANLKSLSIANGQPYGGLLESGDYSDFILIVDGEKLKVHKAILSTHSPVFKAMFEAEKKEKAEGRVLIEGRIVIEDLTLDVANELLKFIYTGKTESLDTLAEELLSAADKYGLDLLKQICGQYLVGQVTTDSAARLLALADGHSIPELKSTCLEFIRKHSVDVMPTQDSSLVDKLLSGAVRLLKKK